MEKASQEHSLFFFETTIYSTKKPQRQGKQPETGSKGHKTTHITPKPKISSSTPQNTTAATKEISPDFSTTKAKEISPDFTTAITKRGRRKHKTEKNKADQHFKSPPNQHTKAR